MCCLVLKAPASSAVPGTAVAWHACKHTSTGRVSRHPPARRHLRTKTGAELRRPPKGGGRPVHTRVAFFRCGAKTRSEVLKLVAEYLFLCRFGFRHDFVFDDEIRRPWLTQCRVSLFARVQSLQAFDFSIVHHHSRYVLHLQKTYPSLQTNDMTLN